MASQEGNTATLVVPAAPEHKFLGETYGFWCQTLVLFAAAVFAYVQIRSSRKIERRKAAAEAIFASRNDKELKEARSMIKALHAGERKMSAYAKDENSEEIKIIRYALNHYEYVAVAISQGIYDEAIFKNAMYTTLTRLYDRTKPFIDEVRKSRAETAYQDFECLMVRWKADPLKVKRIRAVEDKGWLKRLFNV